MDSKNITIDLNFNEGEQELPSQAQFMASPATGTVRKMDPSAMHATYNSDRNDLEFTDAHSMGMGTGVGLQGATIRQNQQHMIDPNGSIIGGGPKPSM